MTEPTQEMVERMNVEGTAINKIKLSREATLKFVRYIRKSGDRGCWLWTGTTGKNGYGRIILYRKKRVISRFAAHRYSWTLW